MSNVNASIFDKIYSPIKESVGFYKNGALLPPNMGDLLAWYKTSISDGNLQAYKPYASHTTQQVKSSGFLGAGSATVTGLLTTDTITASGPSTPTCTVDGTLTFPGPDCWDIDVFRGGVLWASWKGINVGKDAELDASGNGHHLIGILGAVITERLDGTGSNYANEVGFTVADGGTHYGSADTSFLLPAGTRFIIGYEPDEGNIDARYTDTENYTNMEHYS